MAAARPGRGGHNKHLSLPVDSVNLRLHLMKPRQLIPSFGSACFRALPATYSTALAALTLGLATLPAPAGDWPQWGGTDGRNMVSEEKGLPERSRSSGKRPTFPTIDHRFQNKS